MNLQSFNLKSNALTNELSDPRTKYQSKTIALINKKSFMKFQSNKVSLI